MNIDAIKIVGLCCLTVMFCVSLILDYSDPEIWGTILGLFSLLIGGGTVIKNAFRGIIKEG